MFLAYLDKCLAGLNFSERRKNKFERQKERKKERRKEEREGRRKGKKRQ